ncbi:MAG: hypothetical protein PHD05_08360 [Sphaerochaetaceae bacterium]|nr:hypothetical protein [Sphaerochaetaceae bacterium]
MDKEISKFEPWTYEDSVEECKTLVKIHTKVTLDLVKKLAIMRERLSQQGFRSDKQTYITSTQMGQGYIRTIQHTWEEFLRDVGLPKSTVNRWLLLFDPKEDRMLTQDEFKARKFAEFEELIKELEASVGKPEQWRPDGWSTACENYYKTKIRERKYLDIAKRERFEAAELFDKEYLSSLSAQIDYGSPEEILEFGKLCETIKPFAVKAVPVNKQARVLKLVETALNEFQPAVRKDVARFVAEMLVRREENE